MKTGNSVFQGRMILAWALIALAALWSIIAYLGSGSGGLMSQFSGTSVTPSTAASLWQPSSGNPNRALVAGYSARLDGLVRNILGRGSDLTAASFITYLGNLSTGITSLATGPKYADDAIVQKMSAYLTFELGETATALSAGGAFLDDLTRIVDGTEETATSNTGTTAVTNTGGSAQVTVCNTPDIVIGAQTWAGCNSILWNGTEYVGSTATADLGTATIPGKLYTWANQDSACPAGWRVPSRSDFQTLFATLGCPAYHPGYETSVICPGLGWKGNGNTLAKALKLPLAWDKDTRFSADYQHRWTATYLATSTAYENDATYRRSIIVDKNSDKIDEYASPKDSKTEYSVRCIKAGGANAGTATVATAGTGSNGNDTRTTSATNGSASATCTRSGDGTAYPSGSVRCSIMNWQEVQVRCEQGNFTSSATYTLPASDHCVEYSNPTATGYDSAGYWARSEPNTKWSYSETTRPAELSTGNKAFGNFKKIWNPSAKQYGDWVLDTCMSGYQKNSESPAACEPEGATNAMASPDYKNGQWACILTSSPSVNLTAAWYAGTMGSDTQTLSNDKTYNQCLAACNGSYQAKYGKPGDMKMYCHYEWALAKNYDTKETYDLRNFTPVATPVAVDPKFSSGDSVCNASIADKKWCACTVSAWQSSCSMNFKWTGVGYSVGVYTQEGANTAIVGGGTDLMPNNPGLVKISSEISGETNLVAKASNASGISNVSIIVIGYRGQGTNSWKAGGTTWSLTANCESGTSWINGKCAATSVQDIFNQLNDFE